ncbi:MAG: ATP-binding protein [Oscillospiraceae bacterium]|nr:ATP-binding protein [Oscillospiraceae bacterium]MBQ6697571.1 ATP-binding protein [Oscillospiraceae bacterium]
MFKINPYRPGAGLMPTFLAGRENNIEEIKNVFEALKHNIPTQSVIYSGLRGVGKTVLMNKFYTIAKEMDLFCEYVEIDEKKDFTSIISDAAQEFLKKAGIKEKGKPFMQKAIEALKSLVLSFNPEDSTFSVSVQERELYVARSYERSLTQVFTSIGEIAYETEMPICFIIDEIQYMKKDELGALISAIHRANQLGYPIVIIGAGLPKIVKMLSDIKSYSERLFVYRTVGSLTEEHAEKAIIEPAKKFNVEYSQKAIDKIFGITKGYPFFIQQLCKVVYDIADGKYIDEKLVDDNAGEFFDALDNGFFKSRYERCSDAEKVFVFSMVKCGKIPCTISNISKHFGKNGKSISPTRAKLIDKGIIYSTKHGELDFTVPEFDGFIKRLGEYEEWMRQ